MFQCLVDIQTCSNIWLIVTVSMSITIVSFFVKSEYKKLFESEDSNLE